MKWVLLAALAAWPVCAQDLVTVRAERMQAAPVLSPGPGWWSGGAFNPAAVKVDGKTALLFRARDAKGVSRIGYAESADGLHFTVRATPVLEPETAYEKGGGVEDPRVVRIDGTYYLTYTGYNGHDAQLCMATSRDLLHWKREGVILPAYRGRWNTGWTKSGAILPQKVNGRWWMYYLGTKTDADGKARDYMGVASSADLLHWADASGAPVLKRREGAFDARVMEPGPAPVMTRAGIVLLYNGASEELVYSPAWALFDARDPARLIARAARPFMRPETQWEKVGVVPNVVFLEGEVSGGADGSGIRWIGYYGGADRVTGAARIEISAPGRGTAR